MLQVIKTALKEAAAIDYEKTDKDTTRWAVIQNYLKEHEYIQSNNVRTLLDVSSATANKILCNLVEEGKLEKYKKGSHWAYRINID